MSKKRLTIGLFICHLDNDYAYDICKGVDCAAKELDINLIIFPGMYINATYNDPANAKYDYQYNSIFYYARPENLDALIVSIGTIGSFLSEAENLAFLNHFHDIPILTLEVELKGYPSLLIDGRQGLKNVLEHLIREHHKQHIGFVSGSPGNPDAEKRLDTYRTTLEEAGLPVDESLIVYGNFSEYCEELVDGLLDAHPELDALCFANDQMALGGYNVLKRRGIRIGEDIAVTGYDDVSLALALEPALTTVRANACELGYRSVQEAIHLIRTGSTAVSRLDSSMVIRESCGCSGVHAANLSRDSLTEESCETLTEQILEWLLANEKNTFLYDRLANWLRRYIRLILEHILHNKATPFSTAITNTAIQEYLQSNLPLYYSMVQLNYLLRHAEALFLSLISTPEEQTALSQFCNTVSMFFLNTEAGFHYSDDRSYKSNTWCISHLTRDTMTNSDNLDRVYRDMADKMQRMKLTSSYVYTMPDNEVYLKADGSWHVPEEMCLRIYYSNGDPIPLTDTEQLVSVQSLFSNAYMPQDRRYAMVLTPIFTDGDHHGLLLCETDVRNYHNVYSVNLQLGTALKFLKMYEEQQATNQQLEYTLSVLHEKNLQLSEISTIDELTSLKNRRGFLTEAQTVISSALHQGQRSILLFADMDNLKSVNDKFGHENGDFALRTIASALKTSLRENDIIGRIGGDEFVAFAMLNDQQSASTIADRIREKLAAINETCEKPYYIEASIGIVDFVCNADTNIQSLLKQADDALYENKSHKRASVLKPGVKL